MTNIEKKIQNLLEKTINELGYELYDVIYTKEGKEYYLKIFIDKEAGIGLDDCEKVSNAISDMLDEADYIKEQYFLEVSSAGLERVIREDKHFEENIGNEVEVKLFKPIQKNKVINGILYKYDDNTVEIKVDDEVLKIDRNNITIIKTIYKW